MAGAQLTLKKLLNCFPKRPFHLHCQEQCVRGLSSSNSQVPQNLGFCQYKKILIILMGACWPLAVALVCISPMTNDGGHLVTWRLPTCMSYFWSICSNIFPIKNWVVFVNRVNQVKFSIKKLKKDKAKNFTTTLKSVTYNVSKTFFLCSAVSCLKATVSFLSFRAHIHIFIKNC